MRCQFYGCAPLFWSVQDVQIENNYFDNYFQGNDDSPHWASCSNNFFHKTSTREELLSGGISDSYFLLDYSALVGAGHCSRVPDSIIDGNIYQTTGTHQDMACVEATEGGTSSRTITVRNCIALPNANGLSMGIIAGGFNRSDTIFNPILVIEHNTICGVGTYSAAATLQSIGSEFAGQIASFRSNLIWQVGTPVSPSLVIKNYGDSDSPGTGYTTDALAAATADYNAYCGWTPTASGAWAGIAGATDVTRGTPYDTPMSGTVPPGGHDVNLGASVPDVTASGPRFVDPTRNLQTWDASLGGPGTVAHALPLLAVQNDPSAGTYDARFTTAALIAYVRAGFAPQNPSLHQAAHDGGDIGAVAWVSASSTASGTGSGSSAGTGSTGPGSASGSGTSSSAGVGGTTTAGSSSGGASKRGCGLGMSVGVMLGFAILLRRRRWSEHGG